MSFLLRLAGLGPKEIKKESQEVKSPEEVKKESPEIKKEPEKEKSIVTKKRKLAKKARSFKPYPKRRAAVEESEDGNENEDDDEDEYEEIPYHSISQPMPMPSPQQPHAPTMMHPPVAAPSRRLTAPQTQHLEKILASESDGLVHIGEHDPKSTFKKRYYLDQGNQIHVILGPFLRVNLLSVGEFFRQHWVFVHDMVFDSKNQTIDVTFYEPPCPSNEFHDAMGFANPYAMYHPYPQLKLRPREPPFILTLQSPAATPAHEVADSFVPVFIKREDEDDVKKQQQQQKSQSVESPKKSKTGTWPVSPKRDMDVTSESDRNLRDRLIGRARDLFVDGDKKWDFRMEIIPSANDQTMCSLILSWPSSRNATLITLEQIQMLLEVGVGSIMAATMDFETGGIGIRWIASCNASKSNMPIVNKIRCSTELLGPTDGKKHKGRKDAWARKRMLPRHLWPMTIEMEDVKIEGKDNVVPATEPEPEQSPQEKEPPALMLTWGSEPGWSSPDVYKMKPGDDQYNRAMAKFAYTLNY